MTDRLLNPRGVIGIVGGVGVGKSSVLRILAQDHGAFLIEADAVGHDLMRRGGTIYEKEVACFGREILGEDGEIDRKKLGAIVFSDPEKLSTLNAIAHPAIREEIGRRIRERQANPSALVHIPLIVVEAALPEEAGMLEFCDVIWAVTAPRKTRIERLMASRGYTREKCLEIMANQRSEEDFLALADAVIDNGGTHEKTAQQIAALVAKYLNFDYNQTRTD